MKTIQFKVEEKFELKAFAVVSSERNYRFCWLMNNHLNIQLAKNNDHIIFGDKGSEFRFDKYSYYSETDHIHYHLLKNKGEDAVLLPEFKQVDYILVMSGEIWQLNDSEIKNKLLAINQVQWANLLDVNGLKSKHNFIIDE